MKPITAKPPSWVETSAVQIMESRTIHAPPSAVWKELINNETWTEWFPGFRQCQFSSDPPHAEGSIRVVRQDQFKVHEQITTWIPDQEWGMTVIAMNIPVVRAMAENVELVAVGDNHTQVRWHIGVQTAWWARPLQPVLVAKSRRGLEQAMANLDARMSE